MLTSRSQEPQALVRVKTTRPCTETPIYPARLVGSAQQGRGVRVTLAPQGPREWSPEIPGLYAGAAGPPSAGVGTRVCASRTLPLTQQQRHTGEQGGLARSTLPTTREMCAGGAASPGGWACPPHPHTFLGQGWQSTVASTQGRWSCPEAPGTGPPALHWSDKPLTTMPSLAQKRGGQRRKLNDGTKQSVPFLINVIFKNKNGL